MTFCGVRVDLAARQSPSPTVEGRTKSNCGLPRPVFQHSAEGKMIGRPACPVLGNCWPPSHAETFASSTESQVSHQSSPSVLVGSTSNVITGRNVSNWYVPPLRC